jgi:hypothetical protein
MVRVLSATGVVLWGAAAAAGQNFAYNTFSGNFQYEVLAGSTVSGASTTPGYNDTANQFVPTQSGNISDIWVAMALDAGPNEFVINLRSDDNHAPGGVIFSWTLTDRAFPFDPNYHDPVHLVVTDPVPIQQGTPYWLEMHAGTPTSWLVWDFTRPPLFQNVAQRFSENGPWNVLQPGFTSAYAIAVVPGPGAFVALGAGVATVRRRRRA